MKKLTYVFSIIILASVILTDSYAQSFYTGAIGVTQSNGGRTRIFSDNLTTRQVDRASILVGVSSSAVFDYTQDQNGVVNAATVSNPQLSDFEVTSVINNSYSNLPPVLEVAINLYGWTNGAYILARMRVKNNETSAINAIIGLEVIPQVDGAYGGETVQYDAASKTTLVNKNNWVGFKFFSGLQTSLKSFNWVSGYGSDPLYYQWLTQGTFDPPFTAGVDGAVAILGQNGININPGAYVEFYFGISLGANQSACIDNMNLCQQKYNLIVPVELTSFTGMAKGNSVALEWTTASELNNRGFEVERRINEHWTTVGFVEGKGTTSETQVYNFIDRLTETNIQTISYRLKQIDYDGRFEYSNEIEVNFSPVPDELVLEQNYPNPFNPVTNILYRLPESGFVSLKIFDAVGNQVAEPVKEYQSEGSYNLKFDASNLSSGIYFYTVSVNGKIKSNKMILMK